MSVTLSKPDHEHLIETFIGLMPFRTESGRVNLVSSAFFGIPIENKIWANLNLAGDTRAAVEDLLRELCRIGRVTPEQEALALLIRAILERYGEVNGQAEFLSGLIERYGMERPLPANAVAQSDLEVQSFEPETVLIPEGSFLMGSPVGGERPAWETPQHSVELPEYRIGKYPVTCAQYAEFVHRSKRLATPELGWDGQNPPEARLNHPVSGVTWYEALAYCQWLSAATGRSYSLPNEAQWEKSARGSDGRRYPWGNAYDPARCAAGGPPRAVDALPPQSIFNVYDLVGSVRQWTCSLWGVSRPEPDRAYGYPWKDDGRNDLTAHSQIRRVFRGGSLTDLPAELICAARGSTAPDQPGPNQKRHGFRVVLVL
jgi:formylglycine-generating enzyme required for sulfatase activity